jgi:hypothetical protein
MALKPIPILIFLPGYGDSQGLFVEEESGGWYCVAIGELRQSVEDWRRIEVPYPTPKEAAEALLKLYEQSG